MKNNFDEKSALMLIEDMIKSTKEDIKDSGFYFLLWGYLVFIAALSDYYLLEFSTFEIHGLPWIILMPLGGIITMITSRREKKKERVKTYVSESLKYMVRAFCISLFIVCFTMPAANQWRAFYPSIMLIYAMWLYVSGGLLRFKPLMYGAGFNWLIAAVTYFAPTTQLHLLLIALAVLGGYIIPGHMLNARKQQDV